MITRSALSRLALGGAIASAANASGAIVIFDTNGAFIDAASNGTYGEYLAFGSIARNGTFTTQKWGYFATPSPYSAPSVSLLANAYYGHFSASGNSVAFAAAGNLALFSIGAEVSSTSYFQYGSSMGLMDVPAETRYLGLRIKLDNNDMHYGWLELSRSDDMISVPRFAFNDVAGESILAGQTTAVPEASTLGLAGGLFGLVALAHARRRKAKQAAASEKFLALAAGEKLN